MSTEPIRFYNRYTDEIEQEKILGEKYLRWIYGTTLGRVGLHVLVKRAIFSKLLGAMKNSRKSAETIPAFIEEYGINTEEIEKPLDEFTCFNDFFYRKLKPGARPLAEGNVVVLPADGRHMGWQDAATMQGAFVKGQKFDLPALLGSEELAEKYEHGTVVLSRLCPVDYHRFHFVAEGTPEPAHRIPGPLASVSPYCLRSKLAWLWTNKRELTVLHTERVGDVLQLAVGATGVGAIYQTYEAGKPVAMGAEQGYFGFGGSTVMTFFEPGRIELAEDISRNTAECRETFARQGDLLGKVAAN